MATTKPASRSSAMYRICEKFITRKPSAERVTAWINKIVAEYEARGSSDLATFEIHLLGTLDSIISYHRGGLWSSSLLNSIYRQQVEKCQHFGDKAYRLSEKQLAVFAREISEQVDGVAWRIEAEKAEAAE